MADAEKQGLQIDEALDFQRHLRVAQHVGWVVLIAIVAGGIAGLLGGGGPLADRTVRSGALQATYPAYARANAPLTLEFEVDPAPAGGPVTLVMDGDLAGRLMLEHFAPQPSATRAGDHRLELDFDTVDAAVRRIRIEGRVLRPGRLTGGVALADQPRLPVRSFVYP